MSLSPNPLLNQTPVILNDISTPEASTYSISEELAESSDTENTKAKTTEKALLDAGYTLLECSKLLPVNGKMKKVSMRSMAKIDLVPK